MFLFGWIPILGATIIKAIKQLIGIVLLVTFAIAVLGWAKTHPEQAQALVNQVADALALLLPKLINALVSLLTNFLTWLSTVGGS